MFQTLEDEEALKFHYISHTALDVIGEKISNRKETASGSDMYIGLLFPTEVYKVYGYVTNSKTKIIVVCDDSEVKDSEMKPLFQRLHSLYVDAVSNPFHVTDKPIVSQRFEDEVSDLVSSFSTSGGKQFGGGGGVSGSGSGGLVGGVGGLGAGSGRFGRKK